MTLVRDSDSIGEDGPEFDPEEIEGKYSEEDIPGTEEPGWGETVFGDDEEESEN